MFKSPSRLPLSLSVLALVLGASAPASAAVLLSQPGVSPFRPISGSYTYYFDASADGAGTLDFGLVGRGGVDGHGAVCGVSTCDDTFTLILNGDDLFQGQFRIGGQGVDLVLFAPPGSQTSVSSGAPGAGGTATLSLPALFRQGQNSLTFVYNGREEGIDEEAWAISDLVVRDGLAAIPEPSSWALLITGFGLAGAALRRRAPRRDGQAA